MTKFLFLFLLVSGLQAHAGDPCDAAMLIGENIVVSEAFALSLGGCYVRVTPKDKPEMRYRDYFLDQRGRLLVFTSTPGDDLDKVIGSRTYFLFPRQHLPSYEPVEDTVSLKLPNGKRMVFSSNARPISFPGEFVESSEINLENNGGFEIKSFEGIRLDAGWKVGTEAYKDPTGHSVFYDAHNSTCEITNDEFFLYFEGEPNLRYEDDKSLADFLKGRCPNIDLSPLLNVGG